MLTQTHALRKYLAGSGLTEMNPGGRHYRPNSGKILEQAIPAGFEPLQVQPKVERKMRCFLKKHDPGALFSKIANQQRGQSVSEANHAARGQTAKRRDSESVAAAGTKLQRSVASEHDSRERAEAAGVIAERNRGRHNNECLRVECKVTSSVTTPEVRRGKGGRCPWPEQRPDAQVAAKVLKRSRSARPEREDRDGPRVCHPST